MAILCLQSSFISQRWKEKITYDILILNVMNNEIPYMLVSHISVLDNLAEMFWPIVMCLGSQRGVHWWRKTSHVLD
jgi:hypothetical protein